MTGLDTSKHIYAVRDKEGDVCFFTNLVCAARSVRHRHASAAVNLLTKQEWSYVECCKMIAEQARAEAA